MRKNAVSDTISGVSGFTNANRSTQTAAQKRKQQFAARTMKRAVGVGLGVGLGVFSFISSSGEVFRGPSNRKIAEILSHFTIRAAKCQGLPGKGAAK